MGTWAGTKAPKSWSKYTTHKNNSSTLKTIVLRISLYKCNISKIILMSIFYHLWNAGLETADSIDCWFTVYWNLKGFVSQVLETSCKPVLLIWSLTYVVFSITIDIFWGPAIGGQFEAASRPAFEMIESVVYTVGSVSQLLDSSYNAVLASFR